jgi:hypothetical protein
MAQCQATSADFRKSQENARERELADRTAGLRPLGVRLARGSVSANPVDLFQSGGEMNGEILLGRGEYDVCIATGRPPCQVAVSACGGSADAVPVILEAPRILTDGFAFRATVMAACRIVYQYSP